MDVLKWFRHKIGFLLLFWAQLAAAQTLGLDSILQAVERRNPLLAPYETQARALDAYAAGAKAWRPPMAGLGTFLTPYPFQHIEEERDKGAVMFIAEQQIPNRAKQAAKENYLRSRSAIVRDGRDLARDNLRSETRRLYYEWMILAAKLKVLDDNEQLLVYLKKIAEARYLYNQGSLSEVFKAEGRLYELDNMRVMTRTEIEQRNLALNALSQLETRARTGKIAPLVEVFSPVSGYAVDFQTSLAPTAPAADLGGGMDGNGMSSTAGNSGSLAAPMPNAQSSSGSGPTTGSNPSLGLREGQYVGGR